jgi:hypothetical protein
MKWKFLFMNLFLLYINKFYIKIESLKYVFILNIIYNINNSQITFKNNIKIYLILSIYNINSILFKKIKEKNYIILENIPSLIYLINFIQILLFSICILLTKFLNFIL